MALHRDLQVLSPTLFERWRTRLGEQNSLLDRHG